MKQIVPHIKMIKKYLILIMSLLLITGVIAGIGISNYDKEVKMDKNYRDELLTKTNEGDITPIIEISCASEYCLWSAYQEGIIDSKNNKIIKYKIICKDLDDDLNICNKEQKVYYTDSEIEDRIAEIVLYNLEDFANASIKREGYEPWRVGDLNVTQK